MPIAWQPPGSWTGKYTDWPLMPALGTRRGPMSSTEIEEFLKPIQVADELLRLTKDVAPLTYITRQARKESVKDTTFFWFDDDLAPFVVGSATNETTPGTTVTLSTGHVTRVRVNDVLFNPRTGEYMLVTGVNDANNQITVVRGFAGSTATNLNNTDQLVIVAGAWPEGTGAPTFVRTVRRRFENYTQIFKRSFSVTGTQMAVQTLYGPEVAYQERKIIDEFALEIERACIFGVRSRAVDSATGTERRTTDGVLAMLGWSWANSTANCPVLNNTTFNLASWVSFFKEVFWLRPEERRVLIASPELIQRIVLDFSTGVTGQTIFRDQSEKTYGLAINVLQLQFGELNLVPHPLLRAAGKVKGIVLAPSMLAYRYLEANGVSRDIFRQVKPLENQAAEDVMTVNFVAELGFQLRVPEMHGIIFSN